MNFAFEDCTNLTSVTIPYSVKKIGSWVFEGCTKAVINVHSDNTVYASENGALFSKCKTFLIKIPEGWQGAYNIPDTVNTIVNNAFSGCIGLSSVIIPNSVTIIRGCAFKGCTGLTTITIPYSVTEVKYDAFSGCTGLSAIKVHDENSVYSSQDGVLFNKDKTELVIMPKGWRDTYNIPDFVIKIGYGAFEGCFGLTSVTVPNSVTEIGYSTFEGCKCLKSITIPKSVTKINNGAFGGCTDLYSIKIHEDNSVYSSEDGVLFNKDKTELIKMREGCQGVYNIPDSVIKIGSSAFKGSTGLTFISIPNSVTEIGYYAFENCIALTSITIPNSVKIIGDRAFLHCTGLTFITIPESVEEIKDYTFQDCYNLESIDIPESVKYSNIFI